jgi:hypothetical protein
MIDPELRDHLEKIEDHLSHMRVVSTSLWQVFLRGCLYGIGYVVGAVIIILVVGWILNIVGVIPAFTQWVAEFRTALQNVGGTVR